MTTYPADVAPQQKMHMNGDEEIHVMTKKELMYARPELATEKMPDDLQRRSRIYFQGKKPEFNFNHGKEVHGDIWEFELPDGFSNHAPGIATGRLDPHELAKEIPHVRPLKGFRPPWLDKTYLPQIIDMPKFKRPTGQRLFSFGMEWPELAVSAYPYCTIGKVEFSNGKAGTGVLVGRNIMLTCSHGVPWDQSPWSIKFSPAFFDGENASFGHSFVSEYRGYRTDPEKTDYRDYVVCRLFDPLGDRCGFMGSYGTGDDGFYLKHDTWITVGYPGTSRPQTEFLIDINDVDDDGDASELETPWNSRKGWSGGPLFGWINNDIKVIGVTSGNEIDSLEGLWNNQKHAVFAGGVAMSRLVTWARENWPV